MNVQWNPDALRQAATQAARAGTGQMQGVLDSLAFSERGKDVEAVRATLTSRWQQELGVPFPADLLQRAAENLAGGTRVVLNPRGVV